MLKAEPKRLFKILLATFTLLLVAFNLYSYLQQKNYFARLFHEKTSSSLREFIPVLNERSSPISLLSQCVFSALNDHDRNSNNDIAAFTDQLGEYLSENSMIMMLDPENRIVFSKNVQNDQRQYVHRATELFSRHCFVGLHGPMRREAEALSNKLFQNSIKIHHVPNLKNALPVKFTGKKGILFIGLRMRGNPKKSVSQLYSKILEPQKAAKNNHGSYFIFVPESTYLNKSWYQRTIEKKRKPGSIPDIAGAANRIRETLQRFGQAQAADKFNLLSSESSSGSFIVGRYGYCFTEVSSFSKFRNRFFVLHQREISQLPFSISEKAAIFMLFCGVLMLFTVLFKISNRSEALSISIESQFLAATLFSLVFPIAGMLFQESTRSSLEIFVRENEIFSQLETRFFQTENGIEERLSDIFNCMYLYQEIYNELGEGDQHKFVKALRSIRDRRIYNTIICRPDGKIRVTDTGKVDDRDVDKTLKTALMALAKFSIENLNLPKFLPRGEKEGTIESLAFDSLSEGFDRSRLYENSINQMQLQPFNLGQFSVWIFNDIEYDQNFEAQKLFFLVIDRNRIIRELIDESQQKQNPDFPELLFYINIGPYSSISPTWGESKPDLAAIFAAAAHENEEIKHSLPVKNGRLFLLGRRLKELEWVALATHFEPASANGPAIISWSAISATVYIAIILFILTFYFQHFFTEPINQMRNAVMKMVAGDFKNKLPQRQPDELGRLFSSFNEMAEELEEKEYLSRFLSSLAKEAISENRPVNGTKINATILFSDIRGFTSLTEQNSAEEIVEMLNAYMTEMETVIEKHSGSIEKYIGDAIMAVFLPELGKAHPAQRATEAALAMTEALAAFNKKRTLAGKFTLANGAGIATGELLMGSMGNLQGQQRYTVTGAVVNVAAEMEKHSKHARQLPIVLCPTTATKVKLPRFVLTQMQTQAFELMSNR